MTGRLGGAWRRHGYRPWARLLHRFGLHHTRRIGPLESEWQGRMDYVIRCEWCGLSRVEHDPPITPATLRRAES